MHDPQLAHRAFFRRLEHPEMGEVPYEGHQFRIAGYDNGPRFPAPCLGEHTYEVLTEVLGLDDDEVCRGARPAAPAAEPLRRRSGELIRFVRHIGGKSK